MNTDRLPHRTDSINTGLTHIILHTYTFIILIYLPTVHNFITYQFSNTKLRRLESKPPIRKLKNVKKGMGKSISSIPKSFRHLAEFTLYKPTRLIESTCIVRCNILWHEVGPTAVIGKDLNSTRTSFFSPSSRRGRL